MKITNFSPWVSYKSIFLTIAGFNSKLLYSLLFLLALTFSSASNSANVKFSVDMSGFDFTHVALVGSFNNWQEYSNVSWIDNCENDICEFSLQLNFGSYDYKFVIDGDWDQAEYPPSGCATTGEWINRQVTVVDDVDIPMHPYDLCAPINFTVAAPPTATNVRMTGPTWNWNPNGGPVAINNGDNTWTVTLDNDFNDNFEYLWVVDGVQEALYDNAGNGECGALISTTRLTTDYLNWANRQWPLASGDVTSDAYESCNSTFGSSDNTSNGNSDNQSNESNQNCQNSVTGSPVDSSKWFHQTIIPDGSGWFNGEVQHYTNCLDNSYISDGTLKIVAKKETFSDQGVTKQYTSARLNSKYAFKYGTVEFRAKMPSGYGTWPAVWMLNKNIIENGGFWSSQYGTTSWPHCGEIDILEHWGKNPGYAQSAMHNSDSFGATVHHGGQPVSNIFSQFHTYKMEWNAEEIIFYVDDIEHYTYEPNPKNSAVWPYDDEFYLILNVALEPIISDNFSFSESQMEIDWLRVYHHETGDLLWSDEFGSLDTDNDGVHDDVDVFPNDPNEFADSDNDGVGDNADAFPNDDSEDTDSDNDGVGDNADAFPNDENETADSDNDGVGDNADAFPNDASEDTDSDNDGVGDNTDAYPNDPSMTAETQIISLSNNPNAIRNGQVSVDIEYNVSTANNNLTGIGFRIHFDSSLLQFAEVQDMVTSANIASGSHSQPDTDDFDNNPATDSFVTFAWASFSSNPDWPGIDLPAKLLTVVFDVNAAPLNTVEYTTISFSGTSSATGYEFSSTSSELKILPSSWDFDSNGKADALTDGLLLLRHAFGMRGEPLSLAAVALDSTSSASEVEDLINASTSFADIDGDGRVDALTDGLLLIRYLFGMNGESLVQDMISPNSIRTTHTQVISYILSHMPEQTIGTAGETPP